MTTSELALTSVDRVARSILDRSDGPMSTMKLQKLCYFAQGWVLAWTDGVPLFSENFQAWKNGPVCYELFDLHRGRYSVEAMDIDPSGPALQGWQEGAVAAAIEPYLPLTGAQLSALTHEPNTPWAKAREGIPSGSSSQREISKDSMRVFFERLMDPSFIED